MVGFIIAVIAGFMSKQAEGVLARPVAGIIGSVIKVEEDEISVLSFVLVMLLAGIASALFNSGTSFWIILGGALGFFGMRIVAAIQAIINPPQKGD